MTTPLTRDHLNDSVTRHMRREFTRLRESQSVGEALASIRDNPPAERIIYFYVVDDVGRLSGVVPTRRLLLSPLDRPIRDVMVRRVIAIPHTATVLLACELFALHRLLALPVIDDEKRVVGVVDMELYTNELTSLDTHERSDEIFQLIGVHVDETEGGAVWRGFRARFPWLLCNIAGGMLAAVLSSIYEEDLRRTVALALFIPVVLALSESVSIQSVTLALRLLHQRQPSWGLLHRRGQGEALTGILLGLGCGGLVAIISLVWLGDIRLALCLLGGIAAGVTAAAGTGFGLPIVLRLLQRDPQVAAGPVALATADMITLLVYFNLARWLLSA